MILREPRPSRKGARPRVAKLRLELPEEPMEARGLLETVAAALIIRGVMIAGATMCVTLKRVYIFT